MIWRPGNDRGFSFLIISIFGRCIKGSFNNYVDKMRGGGGQKMSVFVHAQGIKTVHAGGGSKNDKILST